MGRQDDHAEISDRALATPGREAFGYNGTRNKIGISSGTLSLAGAFAGVNQQPECLHAGL
jgi:hypothetical protein